jgi:hypothetical protein
MPITIARFHAAAVLQSHACANAQTGYDQQTNRVVVCQLWNRLVAATPLALLSCKMRVAATLRLARRSAPSQFCCGRLFRRSGAKAQPHREVLLVKHGPGAHGHHDRYARPSFSVWSRAMENLVSCMVSSLLQHIVVQVALQRSPQHNTRHKSSSSITGMCQRAALQIGGGRSPNLSLDGSYRHRYRSRQALH